MGYKESVFSSLNNFFLSLGLFLIRYPNGMLTIAIVLSMTSNGYSYLHATLISAFMWIACAFSSPLISRGMDRIGYQKVLYSAAICFILSIILFLLALHKTSSFVLILISSSIMGAFIPSYGGSAIRGIWQNHFSGRQLQAAVAWEGILDDLMYTIGPILSVFLFYKFGQQVLYLAIALIVLAGIIMVPKKYELAKSNNDKVSSIKNIKLFSKIFLLLLLFSIFYGAIFGSVDVVIIARYRELNHAVLSGAAMGAYALSSAAGALIYGILPLHRIKTIKQFKVMVPIMVLAMLPFAIFGIYKTWSIFVTLILAGFVVAPTTIIINALLREIVNKRRLIEATAWIYSSLNLGTAFGGLSVGHILDELGAITGAIIPLIIGALEILVLIYIKRNWPIKKEKNNI